MTERITTAASFAHNSAVLRRRCDDLIVILGDDMAAPLRAKVEDTIAAKDEAAVMELLGKFVQVLVEDGRVIPG